MESSNTRLIIILSVALLVVIAGSGALLYLLPASRSVPTPAAPAIEAFNLQVLQRGGYTSLDQHLIGAGLLPVAPPAVVGKANPFL